MLRCFRSFLLAALCLFAIQASAEPINAVIGDASWVAAHGVTPSADISEVARIRTHLQYVADLLETADTGRLSQDQRARRNEALAGLRAYADERTFPRRDHNDGHGVRRPRFIDDRGVHCAVGELIRLSGHGALAQEIDARWEFAYVPEIASPAMLEWAEDHGFAADELAMIQPSYSAPPSKLRVVADISGMKDQITIICAKNHKPVDEVKVRIHGNEAGQVSVEVGGKRPPFSTCFEKQLKKRRFGGGAWVTQPKSFKTSVKLDITPPRKLLGDRFERMDLSTANSNCVPRPGPLPRTATLRFASNAQRVIAEVRTQPNNPEVDVCLEKKLLAAFRDVGTGNWDVDLHRRLELQPRITSARLDQVVPHYVGAAATQCYETGTPTRLKVETSADPATQRFAITIEGGTTEFRGCVEEQLRERLRSDFSVSRELSDGKYERFFRIDAAVVTKHVVEIETPAASQRRREKHQKGRRDLDY